MKVLDNEYLLPGAAAQYRPHISKDGRVPTEAIERALAEYEQRENKPNRLRPVLVAVGVSEQWEPGESLPKARFLLFSQIGRPGRRGAFFVTYITGPYHGAVDGCFQDDFGAWKRSDHALSGLSSGVSSGGKTHSQPDRRIFPRKSRRDIHGNDVDRSNKHLPYTRLIWEIEYGDRDPIELRQHGKKMMGSVYNRLFLGAKFSAFDADGRFEAAIVLWGKPDGHDNGDTISVIDAVSFGTKNLSDDTKTEFCEHRADRLIGVREDQWFRPTSAGETPPLNLPEVTPEQWMLRIPYRGLLYKMGAAEKDDDGQFQYLLDVLGDDGVIRDVPINLLIMASEFQDAH